MKICLDLDVVLDFLRGDPIAIAKIKQYSNNEELCITAHTQLYLLIGARKEEAIRPFLNSISILDFDKKSSSIAGRLIKLNRFRGKSMGMDEVLTAAMCLGHGAALVTKHRGEFEHLLEGKNKEFKLLLL
jgi:predicted nucleic acid-binding protein